MFGAIMLHEMLDAFVDEGASGFFVHRIKFATAGAVDGTDDADAGNGCGGMPAYRKRFG